MTHLADISVGDEMYVLNSRQNQVFEANIVRVQDGIVVAEIPEKGTTYTFDWETGDALDGKSVLIEPDDWRIGVILDRKIHVKMHNDVISLASEFRKNPSPDLGQRLTDAVHDWREFILTDADEVAVRTGSIQEYLQEKGENWREVLDK